MPSELNQHLHSLVVKDAHLIGVGKLLEELLGQLICEFVEFGYIEELEIQVALGRGATVITLGLLLWGLLEFFVLV